MNVQRVMTAVAITAAVIGLGASLASAIDDLGAVPAFCAETGCETVRNSAWARPLGIPMSVLGVAFYGAMVALSFVSRPRLRRGLALAGAAWAVFLIALQASVIGAWCKLCLIADPAAIVLAIAVWSGARTIELGFARVLALIPALGAVVLAINLWTHVAAPDDTAASSALPAFVAAAQTEAKGTVAVVELLDFECPFCRKMQQRLDAAIAQAGVPVTLVRKMVPLPSHAGAVPAALAWCCAEFQGKGEEMARALLAADPAELTPQGTRAIAERVGVDMSRYVADMERAQERVKRDFNEARAANIEGLPTLYIGEQRFTGTSASEDELAQAIARAAR